MEWNGTIKRTPKNKKANGTKFENEQTKNKMRNESDATARNSLEMTGSLGYQSLSREWEMGILLLSY